MKFHIYLLVSLCLLLNACGPNAEQQAAATSAAYTASAASWTATPTATATATATSTATNTSTPTLTKTATPTRRPTHTTLPTKTATQTSTPDPNRYYAPDNAYSLILPKGWEAVDVGEDEPRLMGPILNGFRLNLSFNRQTSDFPVAMFAAFVQDDLKRQLEKVVDIREDFLTTDDGKEYFRWEATNIHEGQKYHQVFYFYEAESDKLVVVYTRLDKSDPKFNAQVDTAMKSLRFTP